jgi:hypothetical protein
MRSIMENVRSKTRIKRAPLINEFPRDKWKSENKSWNIHIEKLQLKLQRPNVELKLTFFDSWRLRLVRSVYPFTREIRMLESIKRSNQNQISRDAVDHTVIHSNRLQHGRKITQTKASRYHVYACASCSLYRDIEITLNFPRERKGSFRSDNREAISTGSSANLLFVLLQDIHATVKSRFDYTFDRTSETIQNNLIKIKTFELVVIWVWSERNGVLKFNRNSEEDRAYFCDHVSKWFI